MKAPKSNNFMLDDGEVEKDGNAAVDQMQAS